MGESVGETDGDEVWVNVKEGVKVGEIENVELGDIVDAVVCVWVGVAEGVGVSVIVVEGVYVGVAETDGVGVGVCDIEGVWD